MRSKRIRIVILLLCLGIVLSTYRFNDKFVENNHVFADKIVNTVGLAPNEGINGQEQLQEKEIENSITSEEADEGEDFSELNPNQFEDEQKAMEFESREIDTSEIKNDEVTLSTQDQGRENRADLLLENEIMVSDFSQLKQLIENSGVDGNQQYNTYYLTNDIVSKSGGIDVPRDYSFVIDGKNPLTNQIHTFNEYASSSQGDSIWIVSKPRSGTVSMTMKNININGHNYFGPLTSTAHNVEIIFDNVNYKGPQLVYNYNSHVKVIDSTIELIRQEASPAEEIMEARTAEISGHVSVNYLGTTVKLELFTLQESLTINANSVLDINNVPTGMFYHFKPTLNVGKNAKLNLTASQENVRSGTAMIYAGYINNDGDINIKAKSMGFKAIYAEKDLMNNGSINIEANYISNEVIQSLTHLENTGSIRISVDNTRSYVIRVNSSVSPGISNKTGKIEIDVRKSENYIFYAYRLLNEGEILVHLNQHSAASVFKIYYRIDAIESKLEVKVMNTSDTVVKFNNIFEVDQGSAHINFQNSDVLIVIDKSQITDVFRTGTFRYTTDPNQSKFFNVIDYEKNSRLINPTKTIDEGIIFDTQQINLWDNTPDFSVFPNNDLDGAKRFYSHDLNSNFKVIFPTSSNGKVKPGLSAQQSSHTPIEELQLDRNYIYSMGSMKLDVINQTEDNKSFRVNTNPLSTVKFVEKDSYIFQADSMGLVNESLNTAIDNGIYDVFSFGNYLYREAQINYEIIGKLLIKESQLDYHFGEVEYAFDEKIIPQETANYIVVRDERANKTGWKVCVRMLDSVENDPSNILTDMLVFNKDNQIHKLDEYVEVARMEGVDYRTEVKIDLDQSYGLALHLNNNLGVVFGAKYSVNLEWVLVEL